MSNTLQELETIFRKQFRDPSLILTASTSARDIPMWDSFAQISLVLMIEEHFGIKLPTREVMEMKDVSDMVNYVDAYQK